MPLLLVPADRILTYGAVLVAIGMAATASLAAVKVGGLPSWSVFALLLVTMGEAVWLNTAVFVAPLFLAGWLACDRGDSMRSGLFFAGAAALRPWALVVAPMLLARGRRRAALATAGGWITLNLAGLLLPGVTLANSLQSFQSNDVHALKDSNGSLVALFGVVLGESFVPLALAVSGLLVAAVVLFGRRLDFDGHLVSTTAVGLAASPITWLIPYGLVLLPAAFTYPAAGFAALVLVGGTALSMGSVPATVTSPLILGVFIAAAMRSQRSESPVDSAQPEVV